MTSIRDLKSEPPRRKDPKNMAMREQGHMALYRADLCHYLSTRTPTCSGLSPPGQPSVNIIHPGLCAWICCDVNPSYSP